MSWRCLFCSRSLEICMMTRRTAEFCDATASPVVRAFTDYYQHLRAENRRLLEDRHALSMKLVTLEKKLEDNRLVAHQLERFTAVVEIISGVALVKAVGRGLRAIWRHWSGSKTRIVRDVAISTSVWTLAWSIAPWFWPAFLLYVALWTPTAFALTAYDYWRARHPRREHLHAYLLKDENS